MLRSKAIEILRTFNREELKRFRDFVNSPFHNRNKKVIKLFDLVRKSAPSFEGPSLAKEKIFTKLFPGKPYNDLVMRILISDLIRLSEDYLAFTGWKRNPLQEKKFLLDELKERKLNTLYLSNFRTAGKKLETGRIDGYFFFDRFDFENKLIDFLIARDKQHTTGANVLKQGEYLICFSLISILNIAHDLLTHKDVLNVSFDFNMVEEFLKRFDIAAFMDYLKRNAYEYSEVILIYYYMYMSYVHPDSDDYYFDMKKLIFNNLSRFTADERYNLYLILENLCISKSEHGRGDFYQECMDVYERMLTDKDNILAGRGYMQMNLFRNIFLTAVILKRHEWAGKFLNDYIQHIEPAQRQDMLNFTRAVLCFEKGDFNTALECASRINFKFFVFKFDSRILMLKAYYELQEIEPAFSLVDSFAHFVAKNKSVSEVDKTRFGRFLKFYKKLLQLSDKEDGFEVEKLKKAILKAPAVINRKWLLEKAEKLNS